MRSRRTASGSTTRSTARSGCRTRASSAAISRRTRPRVTGSTTADYTWVSDYDWGWAPFHYGRWFVYPGRGWALGSGQGVRGRVGDLAQRGRSERGRGRLGADAAELLLAQPPARRDHAALVQPSYTYVVSTDLFAPTIRERVIRDPVRIRGYEARTRVYEPRGGYVAADGGVRMRVRGPEPTRIGLTPRCFRARRRTTRSSSARSSSVARRRNGSASSRTRTSAAR